MIYAAGQKQFQLPSIMNMLQSHRCGATLREIGMGNEA